MKLTKFAVVALTAAALSSPVAFAQESHEDAVAQAHAKDHKHHTKAKFIGGGAAGGAATGAVVGGPVGAVVGAGVGGVGGAVANKIHRHKQVKKYEKTHTPS